MNQKLQFLKFSLAICLVVALAGLVQPALGQQVTAAITGSVVDPSGAPIQGANIVAFDVERGISYPVRSNEQGIYNLPLLPVGNYNLQVAAKGFQKTTYPPFVLVLNQTARFDVKMQIGRQSETVEVTGSAPLLQTDTTQLSTIIDAKTNETLPLATRNYVQLTMLTPGAVTPDPASMTTGQDMTTSGRPYINGNREQANNFMLEGIDNNQIGDNEVGYSPSVDAIQEFNLISQNASAEFGNFQGGIVSTSIKSGTNGFHGDLFEFFRNDVLNANSWQNGLTTNGVALAKPKLRWNMFGATFGGPIVKNKLFFFVDYQGQRQDHPGTPAQFSLVPSAARGGDLSYLCPEGFSGGVCVNPANQIYNPLNVLGGARQPFLNNRIPTGMINPVATNLFNSKYYPTPANSGIINNFTAVTTQQYNNDQGDLKLDYNLSEKDRFTGHWSQMYLNAPLSSSWALANTGANLTTEPAKNFGVSWAHTISPTVINELRAGFNWVNFLQSNTDNGVGNLSAALGIANGNAGGPGFQLISMGSGFSDIGNIGLMQNFGDTVIQLSDSITISRGRHTLHTGFQFNRYRMDSAYAGNSGTWGEIDFGGGFTAGTADGLSVGGASVADFMLGMPSKVQRGGAQGWGQRSSMFAGFVQDDWRLSNELTVNLGLRYENHTNWVEKNNHQVNFGLYSGAINFAGQNGNSRSLYNSYNLGADFQPRVGLAYAPKALHGKTVFRGAYTLSSYSEGMGSNNRLPQNSPFVPAETVQQYGSTGTQLPGSTLSQGFPSLQPSGTYNGVTDFAGAAIRVWDPNWRPAVSQQWNFSVQHQLSNTMTLQVGYVGQHATHLTNFYWANQRILNADGTTSPGPYVAGNPTLKNEIGAIRETLSNGSSKYKAFQATLDKRFSKGLQGQLSYTLSNCKTDAVGFYGNWTASQTSIGMPSPQDIYNPKGDYGNCNFDVANVVTGYLNYALPFGKGRSFGSSLNPIANGIIGNWEVSGIMSLHTGFAMNFVDGWGDQAGTGSFMERPDVVGKISYPKTHTAAGIKWVDRTAFQLAPLGHFGNEPIGDLRGPGLSTFDFSVHKAFPFSEGRRLEFRAEAINLFNHPILYIGAANLYLNQGDQAGLINQSRGERNIQLAMKAYF